MDDLEVKKQVIEAIKQAIANLCLESDSMFNYEDLSSEELKKIYIKTIKE